MHPNKSGNPGLRPIENLKKSSSLLSSIKTKPAYQDTDLKSREGEIWRPLHSLEEYFHISNFGRLKRLPREIMQKNGVVKYIKEAIKKTSVMRTPNKTHHDLTYQLVGHIMVDGLMYRYSIRRMVYYHFVKKFDLDDSSLVVIPCNGDGLDVRSENLKLVTVLLKVRESVSSGRMQNDYSHVDLQKAIAKSKEVTSKVVSQYSREGDTVATYQSIHEASRKTGVAFNNISDACNGRNNTAGGFYWRHGTVSAIDVVELDNARKQSYREKRGTKVTQFDLKGNPIAHFGSLQEAAAAVGCFYTVISAAIRGINQTAAGYIWRKGVINRKIKI